MVSAPIPKAIAPGIPPSPDHDLKYQGGKTIQKLHFINFYVGAGCVGARRHFEHR